LSLLLSLDLSFELCTSFCLLTDLGLIRGLSWVWTLWTEELIDVVSQHIRVGEHQVHCTVLFRGGFECTEDIVATLDLLDQSIFNCTGIGV